METSYKEKYEQSLAKAKEQYNYPCMRSCMGILEDIFPELKESNDEKVRKALLEMVHDTTGDELFVDYNIHKEEALDWLEKQGHEPKWCHHKVDLSNCSEEYRKAYYDGWNNCNMQHSQCESEKSDVLKCLINGMKFYYEDNEEATWGTEKFSMKVKDILAWLEKQGEHANFRNKIQVGDKITRNEAGVLVNLSQLKRVAKPSEKQGEQKFEMKTATESLGISSDEYNKIVDECIFGEQKPEENKGNIGGISVNWSEEDKDFMYDTLSNLTELKDRYGEGYGNVGKCIDWLKSLKDRVQPQPKQSEKNLVLRDTFGYEDGRLFGMNEGIGLVLDNPEKYGLQKPVKWNKEDENVISLILSICNDFSESFEISPASTKVVKEDVDKIENWLKSLQGRVLPKQEWSEEDINMIDWLIRCCKEEHKELCNDKYGHQDIVSDLKKDCRKKWDWLESLKNRIGGKI